MTEEEKRRHRCCLVNSEAWRGAELTPKLKEQIRKYVRAAIKDGYTSFISGMSRGFEMWAAQEVLRERSKNRNIKLICAPAYHGYEMIWPQENQRELYAFLLEYCDLVYYVSQEYSDSARDTCVKWMIDRSEIMLTQGKPGREAGYAEKNFVEVRQVDKEEPLWTYY